MRGPERRPSELRDPVVLACDIGGTEQQCGFVGGAVDAGSLGRRRRPICAGVREPELTGGAACA